MTTVFGRAFQPLDRAVDVHISHLRKKLGPQRAVIVTVRSVGYLLRLALLALVATVAPANAQTEDLEPRAVGGAGVNAIGPSGFIDMTGPGASSPHAYGGLAYYFTPRADVRVVP
jgi:hypothetical protein